MRSPDNIRLGKILVVLLVVSTLCVKADNAQASPPLRTVLANVTFVREHLNVLSGRTLVTLDSHPNRQALFDQDQLRLVKSQKSTLELCNGTAVPLRGVSISTIVAASGHPCRVASRRVLPAVSDGASDGQSPIDVMMSVQLGELAEYLPDGVGDAVQTPAALSSGVGSIFDVRVSGSRSTFICVSGGITVQCAAGDSVTIGAGQEVTVAVGQAPGDVTSVDAGAATSWTNDMPLPRPLTPSPDLLTDWVPSDPSQSVITRLSVQAADDQLTTQATFRCSEPDTHTCTTPFTAGDVYASPDSPNQPRSQSRSTCRASRCW